MPLLSGFGLWWFGCVWSLLSSFILIEALSDPHTRIKTSAMTHHSNNSVRDHMKWVSETSSPESESWIQCVLVPIHFTVCPVTPAPLTFCFCNKSHGPLFVLWHVAFRQAGLLGCEAVLSSMALMQANNIPGQKKMMPPLGQGHRASPESHHTHSQHSNNHHGHQVHHGQPLHSHMGHSSTGNCPPLVREMPATAVLLIFWGR